MSATAPPANADQIAYWNEQAGPKWVTQQAMLDAQLGPAATLLREADADTRARVRDAIGAALSPFRVTTPSEGVPAGSIAMPGAMWLVTGRRELG